MIFLNRFNILISKINFKKIKNILTKLRYKFMLLIKKTKKPVPCSPSDYRSYLNQ